MLVYLMAFLLTMLFSNILIKKSRAIRAASGGRREIAEKQKSGFKFTVRDFGLLLLSVFPFWFISAFRYDVGTDYLLTYVKFFEYTQNGLAPYDEPLFQLFNNFLVFCGLNYVWLFAICGALINVLVFYFIFKNSSNPLLSIAIYFCSAIFFNTLNNVRQYLAIAISALAFFQKKHLKSLILVIIASLIHFSAVIFLVLLVVTKFKQSKTAYLLISLLAIALSPLIVRAISSVLEKSKYNYFIGYSSGFSWATIIINSIVFLLTVFYYDNKDNNFKALANIQFIALILCVCSVIIQNEELWMRLIRMPAFFQLILCPAIIKKEKSKLGRQLLTIFILLLYSAYTVYTVCLKGGLDVLPYKFIF